MLSAAALFARGILFALAIIAAFELLPFAYKGILLAARGMLL